MDSGILHYEMPEDPVPHIEIAKALRAVKGILPAADFERARELIDPSQHTAIGRAMDGLKEEDEFAVLCRLMGTATHMIRLDQTPVIPGDYIVPDFLARFQPGFSLKGWSRDENAGFSCLIEVKATREKRFRIGGSLLQRRRNFAETFNLPLLFAVRFTSFGRNAMWIIKEDADRTMNRIEVRMQDLIDGARCALWDEYFYLVYPGTYFQASYSKEVSGIGVGHESYGNLCAFHIANRDKRLEFDARDGGMLNLFFEAYGLEEIDKGVEGAVTHVLYSPQLPTCAIADLIYRTNRAIGESTYDAQRLLRVSGKEEPAMVNRSMVESIAHYLVREDILGLIGFGDEASHLAKWRRYGGSR